MSVKGTSRKIKPDLPGGKERIILPGPSGRQCEHTTELLQQKAEEWLLTNSPSSLVKGYFQGNKLQISSWPCQQSQRAPMARKGPPSQRHRDAQEAAPGKQMGMPKVFGGNGTGSVYHMLTQKREGSIYKNCTYLFFFFFKHLYWSIIAVQWCVSFCSVIK